MASSALRQSDYRPDTATHPGELLGEYLAAYGMTQVELAGRTGLSKKAINEIIRGKAPVTADTAIKLHRIFNKPSYFWSALQQNHDDIKARQAEQKRLQGRLNWLKKFPVAQMIKQDWIAKRRNPTDQLDSVLQFFGIASPAQWKVASKIAYRQAARFEANSYALSAWLRRGEIEALEMDIPNFNRAAFRQALNRARELTREQPEVFQPQLIRDCAQAGVALVFVPELPKTKVSGCTRWFDGKAMIQLSLRYKSNDQLWFAFFHEAGHILKHGRKKVFLECGVMYEKEEEEADVFARNMLIPPAEYNAFLLEEGLGGYPLQAIEDFADKIGIAPGIVVGRLQHDRKIKFSCGNALKERYTWARR